MLSTLEFFCQFDEENLGKPLVDGHGCHVLTSDPGYH